MQLSTSSIVLLAGALQQLNGVVAAFNPRADACIPAEDTWKGIPTKVVPGQGPQECSQSMFSAGVSSAFITFDCGTRAQLFYDFKKNELAIGARAPPVNGQLTIRAICLENGKQVAHLSLYTPANAGKQYNHEFKGLNRICDLNKPNMKMRFWTYDLTDSQIADCAKRPAIPLGA